MVLATEDVRRKVKAKTGEKEKACGIQDSKYSTYLEMRNTLKVGLNAHPLVFFKCLTMSDFCTSSKERPSGPLGINLNL